MDNTPNTTQFSAYTEEQKVEAYAIARIATLAREGLLSFDYELIKIAKHIQIGDQLEASGFRPSRKQLVRHILKSWPKYQGAEQLANMIRDQKLCTTTEEATE